jgi:hypothetical protein
MNELKSLIGKTINKIFFNKDYLKFETDEGNIVYSVYGDCCSSSYFHDFYGVKNLIGRKVTEVNDVDLIVKEDDKDYAESKTGEVSVYGYQITTEDPEYGPVTAVLSFRNYSNGYYGGSIELGSQDRDVQPEIFDDIIEAKDNE